MALARAPRRPYASSYAATPSGVNLPRGGRTPDVMGYPTPLGGAAGPADAPMQWGGPSVAPPPPFQQSVNLGRATDAIGAATFAAGSPLPMRMAMPAAPAGTPPGGPTAAPTQEYSGAFGTGPAAQKSAEAARAAYIARHMTIANSVDFGNGTNYYQNQGLQNDWNDRQQAQSDAAVGAAGAQSAEHLEKAAALKAWGQSFVPAQADQLKSQGALNSAKAGQITGMTAAEAALANAKASKTTAEGKAIESGAAQAAKAQKDKFDALSKQHAAAMALVKSLMLKQGAKAGAVDQMLRSIGGEVDPNAAAGGATPPQAAAGDITPPQAGEAGPPTMAMDPKELMGSLNRGAIVGAAGAMAPSPAGMIGGAATVGAAAGGMAINAGIAQRFLAQAGGNKEKARQLAKAAGYTL